MGNFFEELKRRNVLRVGIVYLAISWLLIQIIETTFPVFELADSLIRLAIILLLIGFPLVLIFSWLYELTPEGLKLEKDVDRSRSMSHHTGKQLDRTIIVVLTIAIGYFAIDKFVLEPARDVALVEEATRRGRTQALVESYGENSIAVLPFINMSDDASNEYFSDGISEELLNLLAKIPQLRVISRSSSFSYKNKDVNVPTLAASLNVAHVLEGSVRRSGNKVRVTAQLIDARADAHLWSETFDRELDDIFAIQEDIARAVAEKLKVEILGNSPGTRNSIPEAYALYLQARQIARQRTPDAYQNSNALYRQALEVDPNYAAAWNGLATNYRRQTVINVRPFDEGYPLARETAQRAVAADPNHAAAIGQLGRISIDYEGDLETAASYLAKAIQLEPTNTDILANAAVLALNLGRVQEAISMGEHLASRDPLNPAAQSNLGLYYLYGGALDKAITRYRTALTLTPQRTGANYEIGVAHLLKGEPKLALAAFTDERDEEWRVKGIAMALHDLGRKEEYDAALKELTSRWGERWPSEVAQVYAWSGSVDAAFEWLAKSVSQNEGGLRNQFLVPLYAPLHSDSRWTEFRDRTGSANSHLSAIEFQAALPR